MVGIATWLGFLLFGLNYSLLLAVLVGFSVLIPYIGAGGDHSGGWRGAIPVWCRHGILELLRSVSDYSGAGRQPVSTGVVLRSG